MAIEWTIAFIIVYTQGIFRWNKNVFWRLKSKVSKLLSFLPTVTGIIFCIPFLDVEL
jgi:hypothetical protein